MRKNHFQISILKSILRMLTCIISIILAIVNMIIPSLCVLSGGFALAEFLGILEEIYDKRKED